MEKLIERTKLQHISILIVLLIALLFTVVFAVRQATKSNTSTVITSVSPSSPVIGEKVEVKFRVDSGIEDFSIVVLPDTQHYSESYPDIFTNQTQWILDHKASLNIIFVTHLGDIVQHNDNKEEEWQTASKAMRLLDNVVPYGVLPGNHDMQPGGKAIYYNKYFPASRFEHQSWWGGSFNGNKNNYQLFSAGGDDYIIFHLQYCPPNIALSWVNEILAKHSKCKAIITTHAYLGNGNLRLSHCKNNSDGDTTGLEMWNRLVKTNENVFLVLAGHIPGVSRRTDEIDGRIVYQLLSNYQDIENGGNGYLRIMTFQPNRDIIHVVTYSPIVDEYLTDPDNQFDLSFNMAGGIVPTGTVTVSNGSDICVGTIDQSGCEFTLTSAVASEFTATYSGDSNFKGSVSFAVPLIFK